MARFHFPFRVAVDLAGTVYVADMANHTIRKVTAGGVVTTLAGLAGSSGHADGTGSAARFSFPQGLTVDGAGTVYVADGNGTIRRVTALGVVTTLAGLAGFWGSLDGTGSAARFHQSPGLVDAGAIPGLGNEAFSTVIESDVLLVADRTMWWDAGGYGSHAETSVPNPSPVWYLAEGHTHPFDLFYLIQNPNSTAASVEVTYLRPPQLRRWCGSMRSRLKVASISM